MMNAVLLDTNALRAIGQDRFDRLVAGEERLGIVPLVDQWVLMELIAGMGDPKSKDFGPCRAGLKRAVQRCGQGRGFTIVGARAQVVTMLFGVTEDGLIGSLEAVKEWAHKVSRSDDIPSNAEVKEIIRDAAAIVHEAERGFADLLSAKQLAISFARTEDGTRACEAMRELLYSEESLLDDARKITERAYLDAGKTVPSELPIHEVTAVRSAFQATLAATALSFEQVLCNGKNLENGKVRNLIWDQEIACALGQRIHGYQVLVVSGDPFFRQVANRVGHPQTVRTPEQYIEDVA